MMMFPQIDPVAFEIGPLIIRWYALAYIAGILGGWWLFKRLLRGPFAHTGIAPEKVDDFSTWAVIGIILGGRLGYVLFYNPAYYFAHPEHILSVWEGGMAFHGGALGVIVALILFCWKHKLNTLSFGDALTVVVPIGICLGRLANFVNGELAGRPADPDFPLAMVFPHIDALPRHPSQLYEAATEGMALFLLLLWASYKTALPTRPGAIAGLFLAGYGAFRFAVEFARQPDVQLGFLDFGMTMGQILCVPMILIGAGLIAWAHRSKTA